MATSVSGNSNVNINNLNIITFIKDIYLSLKHIDTCFSTFKNDIDARMIKLEGQYETILEKLSQLENSIGQVNERVSQSSNIDSTLEKELLDKMYKLACATEDTNQLELKPRELTIANILENGYTMLDINNSLETNTLELGNTSGLGNKSNKIFPEYKQIDMRDDMSDALVMDISNSKKKQTPQTPQTLDTLNTLLFD
jgi:DNA-binding transcriptional MerR regulator